MIFFLRKKPINVDLFTSSPSVFDNAKPLKASHFVPAWWKKLPPDGYSGPNDLVPDLTIKSCYAFMELYNHGFIHPLWSDLNVQINPNGGYSYQYADHRSEITDHQDFQHIGSPFHKKYTQIKLISPWIARTKNPVNWMWVAPQWNGVGIEDMYIAHGTFPFHLIPSPLHINTFFRIPKETITHRLPFNFPLAHVVPLSENPIKLNHHLVDDVEYERLRSQTSMHHFFSRRLAQTKKICPHGKI